MSACSEKVPLFIVNYNGLENLGLRFLEVVGKAVNASTYLDNLEVVLVDNGSRDASLDIIRERFWDTVTPLRLNSNLGHAMGVNAGLMKYARIRGCIPSRVFIMDNDYVITNPGGLKDMLKYMESEGKAVAVQGVNLNRDGRVSDAGLLLTTFFTATFRCEGLSVSECPEKPSYVSSVISCLALYNLKSILAKRKLLFDKHHIIYHDDVDLSLNMWSHGLTSASIPTVVGVHYWSSTRKRMNRAFVEYEGKRGSILLYRRLPRYTKAHTLLTPYFKELLFIIPRLAMYGIDIARAKTKAFLDALTLEVESYKGSYEPLLVKMPARALVHPSKSLAMLKTLVVDRSLLLGSKRPFIISLQLKASPF